MKEYIKKIRRIAVTGFLGFLSLCLLFPVLITIGLQGFVLWLNTDKGGAWLGAHIESALDDSPYQIKLEKFNLSGLFGVKAGSFELADSQGVFLTGQNLSLNTNPLPFPLKRLDVGLWADQLEFMRLPISSDVSSPQKEKFTVPDIYFKMLDLELGIEKFILSERILDGGLRTGIKIRQKLDLGAEEIKGDGFISFKDPVASFAEYLPIKITHKLDLNSEEQLLLFESIDIRAAKYQALASGGYGLGNEELEVNIKTTWQDPSEFHEDLNAPLTFKSSLSGKVKDLYGEISAEGAYKTLLVSLKSPFAWRNEEIVLSKFSGKAGAMGLSGHVAYDLETNLAEGRLIIALQDFEQVQELTRQVGVSGAGTITLHAFPRDNMQSAKLQGDLQNVTYEDIKAEKVQVSAEIENVRNIDQLTADVRLSNVQMADLTITEADAKIIPLETGLQATFEADAQNVNPFSLVGQVNIPSFDPLSLALDQTSLKTQGGSLKITGGIEGQVLALKVTGQNLKVETLPFADLSSVPIQITKVSALVEGTFEAPQLTLEQLQAKDREGTGTLDASAQVDLRDFKKPELSAKVTLDNMHLLQDTNYDAWLNADIDMKTTADGYLVKGILSPEEISIRLPDRFTQSIPTLNVKERGQASSTNDLFSKTKLDLTFKAENKIFVTGWGLDAELQGQLDIAGDLETPLVEGKLNTVRGRFDEFGRRFNLDHALLRFQGQVPPSPYLDIATSTEVEDITAKVLITNSVENPSVKLASVPSLPEDEVLSLILFGKDISKISPFQAVQLADTLRRFSGQGSGPGFNPLLQIREATGLDDIRVDGVGTENATVGAGKYISDKVYLELETGAGAGSGAASVEIEVTPNVKVESKAGQSGDSEVGVYYEWDY